MINILPKDESNVLVVPRHITRAFVNQHPDWLFIYAHDWYRRGTFGQAWQLHNELNTLPIFTMVKYCANPVYFSDAVDWQIEVDKCFAEILKRCNKYIIPCPKIGRGCSRMIEFAPKLLTHIETKLKLIAYPEIKFIE